MSASLSFITFVCLSVCLSVYIVHVHFRPLPRGLVQYDEVVSVINYSLGAMFVYAGLLALRFSWTIGVMYAIQVGMCAIVFCFHT